jgi:HK97 family phage major capsid protein
MQVEQVELKASALMGLSYSTEELLRLSPRSVAALLEAGFRDEFDSRLIRERIRGTGVGEYMGAMTSPALITISKEVGQDADTIVGLNVLKMRARAWRYGMANWYANHDTYVQIAQLHIAGTNGDTPLFVPGNGVDVPDTLLGRPIYFCEDTATLGDAGDILLADWSQYLEGTLMPLEGAESVHVRFVYNERAFRFLTMNAGAPWWRAALTPKRSSTTLSPFVTLEART